MEDSIGGDSIWTESIRRNPLGGGWCMSERLSGDVVGGESIGRIFLEKPIGHREFIGANPIMEIH
eukprot:10207649-Karenia_brevis.AAC.1